jgi:hypothetical protein
MSPWCNRTQAPDRATRRVRKPIDRLQRRRGGGDAPDGDGPDTGKRPPAGRDSPSWGLTATPPRKRCTAVAIASGSRTALRLAAAEAGQVDRQPGDPGGDQPGQVGEVGGRAQLRDAQTGALAWASWTAPTRRHACRTAVPTPTGDRRAACPRCDCGSGRPACDAVARPIRRWAGI